MRDPTFEQDRSPGARPDDVVVTFPPGGRNTDTDAALRPSDDDLALAFIAGQPLLRYVAGWGKWLQWDGYRWAEDRTVEVYDLVRRLLREIAANWADVTRHRLLSAKTVSAVEKLSRCDRRSAAIADQWDRDDLTLNTPAGMVHLPTGEVRPHDPAAYCTKITAVGPRGECPRWQQFLDEVTNGDKELSGFLQRVAGYAATGLIREHALFFLYGTGGNGKGVFLNTLEWLLADYAAVASMETFTASPTDRHPTDLAMLRGARLVIAQETEEGRAWAESRIKALTGGDPITARFMRQDFFTFAPKFKLLIAGNHKPRLRNVDEAMRRRLHLIPFTVAFPVHKRDPDLADKLKAEGSGIMQWIVEGACEYFRVGLKPPPIVLEATAEYFGAQDLFAQWLEECCERDSRYWETPTRLYASWKRYADTQQERPGRQADFKDRLAASGIHDGRDNARGRYYGGVRVRGGTDDAGREWDP